MYDEFSLHISDFILAEVNYDRQFAFNSMTCNRVSMALLIKSSLIVDYMINNGRSRRKAG